MVAMTIYAAPPPLPACVELGRPAILVNGRALPWCGEPPEFTEPVPTSPPTTVATGITGYVIPAGVSATTAPAVQRRAIVVVRERHVADVLLVHGLR